MRSLLKPLVLGMALSTALVGCTSLTEQPASTPSFEQQKQINDLVQTGMYYYWNGGDLKKVEQEFFKGITLKGKFDVVEASFEQASELAPNRLDLRFGIASTQIIQSKVDDAIKTYESILELDPENFDAGILAAAYKKVSGDMEGYKAEMADLGQRYPEQTADYLSTFERTDTFMATELNTKASTSKEKNHTIVTLGYALSPEGEMRQPLIDRLEQTLAAATKNPEATVIVSGGVPNGGVTESFLMKQWLVEKGVAADRIYMDDKAKDTVGNAIYSTEIMKELGTEHVTLISSASHMRRALSIFAEVADRENAEISFDNLVAMDFDTMEEAMTVSANESLVIYRDMLRGSGIWAYPGLQI
ncbi:YdcF family protein [Endozoicomonas arenosclerae]|uniref:YdcF family protein n=1 Tax=Endozoicomonas arenosclerae TaxID=1633495 RepID=UPI000782F307|nr:YdcF family protein [Endozoicomonas arenosclerae]